MVAPIKLARLLLSEAVKDSDHPLAAAHIGITAGMPVSLHRLHAHAIPHLEAGSTTDGVNGAHLLGVVIGGVVEASQGTAIRGTLHPGHRLTEGHGTNRGIALKLLAGGDPPFHQFGRIDTDGCRTIIIDKAAESREPIMEVFAIHVIAGCHGLPAPTGGIQTKER